MTIRTINRKLIERSQLNDYAYRGAEFNDLSFVDFCLNTYETTLNANERRIQQSTDAGTTKRGPKAHTRGYYRQGHPCHLTHVRIVRGESHRWLPSFIGAMFASPTTGTEDKLYHSSMVALFQPWQSWEELLRILNNPADAFRVLYATATAETRSRIINTQIARSSRDAAAERGDAEAAVEASRQDLDDKMEVDEEIEANATMEVDTEPTAHSYSAKVVEYADGALAAGLGSGLLNATEGPQLDVSTIPDNPIVTLEKLAGWLKEMDEVTIVEAYELDHHGKQSNQIGGPNASVLANIFGADGSGKASEGDQKTKATPGTTDNATTEDDLALNEEQQLALDIIESHFKRLKSGLPCRQLLMKVMGEPGTGKSRVVHAGTAMFIRHAAIGALAKAAHAGVAASLIGGSTLCSLFHVRVKKGQEGREGTGVSQKTINIMVMKFKGLYYIFIDEASQVSRIHD